MTDKEFAAIKARYAAIEQTVAERSLRRKELGSLAMEPEAGAQFISDLASLCADAFPALLAEVERQQAYIERLHAHRAAVIADHEAYRDGLEAENEALREIVRAVATAGNADDFNQRASYRLNYHIYASAEMREQANTLLAR